MSAPLRIGMIGLDTSHVIAFTSLLNDPKHEHHVPGGKVVVGFPGGSPDFESSISRVEGFTKQLRDDWGMEIVDSPEAVAEKCDLLMIESVDGRVHLDQFKATVKYKRPTFIDKPLAVTSAHAKEIFKLAKDAGVPVMTASALRYADALVKALARDEKEEGAKIMGCDMYGPMAINLPTPGLFWYGIHTAEVINRVMGTGCESVSVVKNDGVDIVTFVYKDGRMATLRGSRDCHSAFGGVIHRKGGAEYVNLSAPGKPYYAGMLEAVMATLPKGKSDIAAEDSIEITRMLEAANEARDSGKSIKL